MPLLPYQQKWVMDDAKLKIVSKGRQTGFSFAAALRAVIRCLEKRLTWVLLSKGERQSRLLMEKVQEHVQAMQIAASFHESLFFEGTSIKSLEMRFPNGSVIYGLPANPDTARGYSGNVTLDEFAFHGDSEKIYSALYPTITRGYGLEVISTPNGKQGKYYELAKAAGLVDGEDRDPKSNWSAHRVSIFDAQAQGLPVDIELLRAGAGYEDDWLQEYCCAFISTAENFFPPELVAAIVKDNASAELPLSLVVKEPGEGFLGIDIGRQSDRTVLWLDMVNSFAAHDAAGRDIQKRIATARHVATLHKTPFAEQMDRIRELMKLKNASGNLVRRACIDSTGMGAPLGEALVYEFGGRVEPTVFTGPVKEDMAFRTKRRAESGEIEIPDTRAIRAAFGAVKKIVMPSGAIRFDAERTEAGHADEFWAKALADLAADSGPKPACGGRDDIEETTRRRSVWDTADRGPEEEAEEVHAGVLADSRPGVFGLRRFWR